MVRTAIAVLLIAGLPVAAQAAGQTETTARSAITDHFSLPLEKAREQTNTLFTKFAGADGAPITIDEFMAVPLADNVEKSAHGQEMKLDLFKLLDADGDGILTREEWNERIDMDLAAADANNDGDLTIRELTHAADTETNVLILLY